MLLYSPFAFLLVWIPLLCYGYMRNNLSSNKLGVCFFFFFRSLLYLWCGVSIKGHDEDSQLKVHQNGDAIPVSVEWEQCFYFLEISLRAINYYTLWLL